MVKGKIRILGRSFLLFVCGNNHDWGGIAGAGSFGFKGFIIGVLVFGLFSFFYFGFLCGYLATIAGMAKSMEANTKLLGEIKAKLSDLEAIKNKLNETPSN